jgi:DNA-binding protein Fis
MTTAVKKICFVISPIGHEGSGIRRRADQVLRHIISPAVSVADFETIRADQISEPGMITTQVIQHIIEDPLVIADLTGSNPNVFYELAIRHAIRKPLVQIIQKDEKIPFDVAGMRTIPVDHQDLDSVEEAKQEIARQVKAIIKKKPEEIESPISVSVELQALRQSENPEERSLAEFVSAIAELRSDLGSIEKRLSSPENLIPPQYFQKMMDISRHQYSRDNEIRDMQNMRLAEMEHHLVDIIGKLEGGLPQKQLKLELANFRNIMAKIQAELRHR